MTEEISVEAEPPVEEFARRLDDLIEWAWANIEEFGESSASVGHRLVWRSLQRASDDLAELTQSTPTTPSTPKTGISDASESGSHG